MKYSFGALLLIISLHTKAQSLSEHKEIEHTILDFFEGFSNGDVEKFKKNSTKNLKLIENGQVWTIDTLARFAANPKPADFRRVNTLRFIETEVKGNTAWTSYYNRADVTSNGKAYTRKWMESIVLVKESGAWKIRLLHSTPDK